MSLFEKDLPGNPLCWKNCPRANSYVRLIKAIVEESENAADIATGDGIFKIIQKNLDLRRDSGENEADIPTREEMELATRQEFSRQLESLGSKRDQALDQLGTLSGSCSGPLHTEAKDSLGRSVEIWVCGSPELDTGRQYTSAFVERSGLPPV